MKELDYYPILKAKLEKESVRAYYGKDFNAIGHRTRPDMLIFHNLKGLASPIGLEIKTGEHFQQITQGIYDQLHHKYADALFKCDKEKWEGKLKMLAFTTITACEDGLIYGKHYSNASNFFVERICWKLGVALLLYNHPTDIKGRRFHISYKNKRYYFNGEVKQIVKWDD